MRFEPKTAVQKFGFGLKPGLCNLVTGEGLRAQAPVKSSALPFLALEHKPESADPSSETCCSCFIAI